MATFYDANFSTTGDTEQEAFENLKSLILEIFDSREREPPSVWGPSPKAPGLRAPKSWEN